MAPTEWPLRRLLASWILVLRPRERVVCITKLFARGFPVELPIDEHAGAVGPAIPRAALAAQRRQIRNSALAEALPGKQPDVVHGFRCQPHIRCHFGNGFAIV